MLQKSLRDLPYLVHTNRELGLMLRAVKPMACFMYEAAMFPECVDRYLRMFDRHVGLGRFSKYTDIRVVPRPAHAPIELQEIFYSLPGEAWRAQAKIDLYALPGKWTAVRERRLGELLGYADWQNDVWLSKFEEVED